MFHIHSKCFIQKLKETHQTEIEMFYIFNYLTLLPLKKKYTVLILKIYNKLISPLVINNTLKTKHIILLLYWESFLLHFAIKLTLPELLFYDYYFMKFYNK